MRSKRQKFDVAVTEPASSVPTAADLIKKRVRRLATGAIFRPHRHRWTQLTLCTMGSVRASLFGSSQSFHVVHPSQGLWLPAGLSHMIEVTTTCTYVSLYIDAACFPARWERPRVMPVSVLMRELVEQIDAKRTITSAVRHRAIADLLLDEINASSIDQHGIPLPFDRRLSSLCSEVLDDSCGSQTIPQLAARHGLSERTLLRLSQRELHMSFAAWRRLVVATKAVQALQTGAKVSDVAAASGYQSMSAFHAAFRSCMGRSPSSFRPMPSSSRG